MSTKRKSRPLKMFLSLLPILFTLTTAEFPPFRDDGFSENVLQTLTNFTVHAVAQSAVRLDDDSIVISGILRYPAGMRNHSSFQDERDILLTDDSLDAHRYAGMVLRVSEEGAPLWAKRTVLCTSDATFTTVYDGQHIYVAGSTKVLRRGLGTSECCGDAGGMVLLRYNVNGTQEALRVQGTLGERYVSISLTPAEDDSLFLTTCTPRGAGPYQQWPNKAPQENGLTMVRVRKRDMELVQQEIVSDATSADLQGELVSDDFWDMVVSHDGSAVFMVVNRKILRFGTTNLPVVFTIRGTNLTTEYARTMENELQVDSRVATANVSDGVYLSYVDRRANKENLVISHLAKNLSEVAWPSGRDSTFRYRILLETEFIKEIRSTVKDLIVDINGTVRVLLHSAEVVNQSLAEPSSSPSPEFQRHRRLNNGRPALMEVSRLQEVREVIQAQTAQQWEPNRLLVSDERYLVVGADRGMVFEGVPKVLLTGVNRNLPKRNLSMIPAVQSPSPTPNNSTVDCLGESTTLLGVSIRDIIRGDGRLRLQIHPGRWGRQAEVLCHTWRNGTEDVLCATGNHVVRHWGRAMHMSEFCGLASCTSRVERVLNFKGGCGDDVRAHDALHITMHAGGASAHQAVNDECGMMRSMKLWWWLTTL